MLNPASKALDCGWY